MEISKLFDNILDLPGIEGVCLFGTEGQMYINRLPSFLSNELFVDAQRRIVAMYETMDENFLPCDDYMLRFSERWVLLRRTEKQVLLVLGGEKANLASTRMVTNMTMKHLTPDIVSGLETAARGGFAAPASAGGNSLSHACSGRLRGVRARGPGRLGARRGRGGRARRRSLQAGPHVSRSRLLSPRLLENVPFLTFF
jgi:hypothetical protein